MPKNVVARGETATASRTFPVDVSIIIVSFNTRALTLRAIETLYATTKGVSFELIVWDNASVDGSASAIAAAYPQARLIAHPDNIGFGAANNAAARHATGEMLLLLNPDTEVYADAVANFLRFAKQHPSAGLYAGRTLYPDGTLNPYSCLFDLTPWSSFCRAFFLDLLLGRVFGVFEREVRFRWQRDEVQPVDIVSGCWLLASRDAWEQLGGFNERYFMYGEDVDLSQRARKLGFQPMLTPDAVIMHMVGASSPQRVEKLVMQARGRISLMHDHWPKHLRRWGMAMEHLAAWNRFMSYGILRLLLVPRAKQAWPMWREFWQRRREWARPYE